MNYLVSIYPYQYLPQKRQRYRNQDVKVMRLKYPSQQSFLARLTKYCCKHKLSSLNDFLDFFGQNLHTPEAFVPGSVSLVQYIDAKSYISKNNMK